MRFEVDGSCRHLTTPSLWYSEKAGNWAAAAIVFGLWAAVAIRALLG